MPAPKTAYYRIGSQKDRPITVTSLTPAQLQDALLSSGVRLVAYGDGEHGSVEVKRQFNQAIEGAKTPPQALMLEWPSQDQAVVDAYLKKEGGEKEFKELKSTVVPESLVYAPQRDEAARKDYFAQSSKPYALAKAGNIKIALVDDRNLDKKGVAIDLHNEALEVRKRFAIVAEMMGSGLTEEAKAKATIAMLFEKKEADLRAIAKDVQSLVAKKYAYPEDKAVEDGLKDASPAEKSQLLRDNDLINRMSKDELKDYIQSYIESLPPPKSGKKATAEYTYRDVREMAQAKLNAVSEKKQQAENVRDAERDEKMAGNVAAALGKDGNGVMMIGLGHYGKKAEGRTEPNLEERLRKQLGDKFARVDIIPISPDALEVISGEKGLKQLVAIGGEEGADYTVFVADDRIQYILQESKTPAVDAGKGPHKDALTRVKEWENPAPAKKKDEKKNSTQPPMALALPDLRSVGVLDMQAPETDKALSDAVQLAKGGKTRNDPFSLG